jgi:hypothetical protein
MSELEDLKKEVAKLKDQLNPPPRQPSTLPRYDPTEGMSMPANAIAAMVAAVPSSVMRGLVNDAFKPNPVTGFPNPPSTSQVQRGTGWREPAPLGPPPGIEHVDRLVDAQDRIDKAELALKFAKMELGKAE